MSVFLPLRKHSKDFCMTSKYPPCFSFVEAFSLILVSELGDKTFFVAGLFAMKTNK
jgi:hypothetical protein